MILVLLWEELPTHRKVHNEARVVLKSQNSNALKVRVGKTGALGPWHKVIGYCRSVRMLPVIGLGIRNNWYIVFLHFYNKL